MKFKESLLPSVRVATIFIVNIWLLAVTATAGLLRLFVQLANSCVPVLIYHLEKVKVWLKSELDNKNKERDNCTCRFNDFSPLCDVHGYKNEKTHNSTL